MPRLGFPLLGVSSIVGTGRRGGLFSSSLTAPPQRTTYENTTNELCEISSAILPTVRDFINEFHSCPRSFCEERESFSVAGSDAGVSPHNSILVHEQKLAGGPHPQSPPRDDCDFLQLWLHVGRLSAPLTIIGEALLDRNTKKCSSHSCLLAAHTAGLPGAIVFPMDHLRFCRCRVLLNPSSSSSETLGSTCLLEAVRQHLELQQARGIGNAGLLEFGSSSAFLENYFDSFYRLARRRHFSLLGLEHLMEVGSEMNTEALQLSFPYHCGGEQASKEYFDILPDAVEMFRVQKKMKTKKNSSHPSCLSPWEHGTKVLSRYGVAACVGVRPLSRDDTNSSERRRDQKSSTDIMLGQSDTPALFWHPTGAPAACIAPLLHSGIGTTVVGRIPLEYNGPTSTSPLLRRELPSRYLLSDEEFTGVESGSGSNYDQMTWLHSSLFGVMPGEEWRGWQSTSRREKTIIHGIQFNPSHGGELELYLKGERSGDVFPAADV